MARTTIAGPRRGIDRRIALVSMALRLASLVCRLALTLFIAHEIGLEAMAAYGFVIGAAAILTAASGVGVSYQLNRICTHEPAVLALWRVRDRGFQRIVLLVPILTAAAMIPWVTGSHPAWLSPAALTIVLLEPLVTDLHEALVYRHRPQAGNAVLFMRSASWIPIVMALALVDSRLRTIDTIFVGWAIGLLLTIVVAMAMVLRDRALRFAFARPIDWVWILRAATSYPIVLTSELGTAGMLFGDRFIVGVMLGERAAGAFTFLWSITNAIVPIVQGGVFNQLGPRLATQWRRTEQAAWLQTYALALRRTTIVSIGCGMAATAAITALLPFSDLPNPAASLATAMLMVAAIVIRMRADVLHHALYSAEQDSDWIAVNIVGLFLSPVIAIAIIATTGFVGAGLQAVVIALCLYEMRRRLMHPLMRAMRADAAIPTSVETGPLWLRQQLPPAP